MSDTQWPRWEVFKQDTPKKPHQAVGSVHAADPEHALLTARNVFVRRPQAVSLWVAPATAIFSMTLEELTAGSAVLATQPTSDIHQTFAIFWKKSHRRSMTYVEYAGEVQADSAQEALRTAADHFDDGPAVLVWWVIPTDAIVRSDEQIVESWFAPAASKDYRHQSAYGVVSAARAKAEAEQKR